jgi:hypothetical protein
MNFVMVNRRTCTFRRNARRVAVRWKRLFARSLYSKAVLRSGVLPRMECERPTSSTMRRRSMRSN